MQPLNVHDYEALAAERLETGAHGYYAGGSGDELTLHENVAAYRRWQLRPRVLVDVAGCTTATTVLGQDISMPLLVAPVAFQRAAHPDGEVAMARAVRDAGTIMCLSTMTTSTFDEVAATNVSRWFQLYVFRDFAVTEELVGRAKDAGFEALVLTVDTPVLGRRERDFRTGFTIPFPIVSLGEGNLTPAETFELCSQSVSWRDIERLASISGLPVIVKGVMTAEDGRLACEHGAAAVVVSNHGGRQLDGVSATIDALPEVADAVDGRVEVLIDGGIRRGADVIRALALGARAGLIGRPALWGLACDGQAGARHVLGLLQDEILLALKLVGCDSPDDVTRDRVQRAP